MTMPTIDQPLERLRAFRARFADGATIDPASGLTVDDVDAVIAQAAGTIGEVPLEDLDEAALKPFAPDD